MRSGVIGYYFPSSVIKGMLAGIGLTIILKQLPHAVGYDAEPEGSLAFAQASGETTASALTHMFGSVQPGALLIALVSLAVLLTWERPAIKRVKVSLWVQGPLVAVALGIALNELFKAAAPSLALASSHLVEIHLATGLASVFSLLTTPDFSQLTNGAVYTTALTLAVLASLETLLCVEATDKLDPQKRVTPTDRELKAQGLGNVVSGLIGGLPVTQVIVRSSANIQSGARSKLEAILHGMFPLVAVVTVPALLNRIPLAVLAAILMTVGYKLAKPALFKSMYQLGPYQFVPFIVTVVGILTTDLLVGIGLGMTAGVFALLLTDYNNPFFLDHDPSADIRLVLSEDVSFLNRAVIMRTLAAIKPGTRVVIDATRSMHIDLDVYEILKDFEQRAAATGIDLTIEGLSTLRRENDAMHRVQEVVAREPRRPEAARSPAVA
jgi:MFS superfamily sulfate permease-like transporter